jgi:hypothetical protein
LVSAEDRGTAIEKNLDEAERYLDALDPEPAVGPLQQARQGLAHPDVGYYPERQMLSQRLTEDVKRLAQVRKEREARDRAKVIAERQSDVEKALAKFKPSLAALKKRDLMGADVKQVTEGAQALQSALDAGKELERRETTYAAYVKEARGLLDQSRPQIELAKKRVEFAEGPAAVRNEALELTQRAKAERNNDRAAKLRAQSQEKFAECAKAGERLLILYPALGGTITGNQPLTVRTMVTSCDKQARALKPAPTKWVRSAGASRR